jgi:hypothetical protein
MSRFLSQTQLDTKAHKHTWWNSCWTSDQNVAKVTLYKIHTKSTRRPSMSSEGFEPNIRAFKSTACLCLRPYGHRDLKVVRYIKIWFCLLLWIDVNLVLLRKEHRSTVVVYTLPEIHLGLRGRKWQAVRENCILNIWWLVHFTKKYSDNASNSLKLVSNVSFMETRIQTRPKP